VLVTNSELGILSVLAFNAAAISSGVPEVDAAE
jgi:hypothetical protein